MGRIGRRVADRYRLLDQLGTGGMSEVWRGHDEILGRPVAVKILSPRLAGDHVFRDRMRQEALAAARLCHPHITAIFDFGESPLSDQVTVPYVVMELNDGESVSARLRRDGPLPWHDAVTITAEVASALAAAHARGVVHRDVTPANVMLTSTGAKVVDFGISALVGQRDAAPDGSLLGTPAYLAPERLAGGQVLPATDVYALGLLLYRLLTGRLPWPAGNTAEALRAHLYADPEPLPSGLPTEVTDLCLRCLAKRPADRPLASEIAARMGAVVGMPGFVAQPPVRPRAARSARLRTVLRLAKALHLGRAKPLGGGLFQGGQVAHELFRGRHRVQAALATLLLFMVVGVLWTSTREPAEVGPAQAAAAGAGPPTGVRHAAECKVRYRVEEDTGRDFAARLTVVNTGDHEVDDDWRMEFAYPGTQRLTDPVRAVAQKGRKVVLHGRSGLGPGRSITVGLRGDYRGSNPLPLAFRLDGHICEAEVIGATSVTVVERSSPREPAPSAPAAPAARKKPKPPVKPKIERRTPTAPSPSPVETRRAGGFSVAV
ncbi:MAG TPA: serine/threonine-protein kinase [Actinoplanes sp.]|nr:serine/threonine-protein kinase [Actinoplanes sp.]